MKANLIIIILLLVVVASGVTIIVITLSPGNRSAEAPAPQGGEAASESAPTQTVTDISGNTSPAETTAAGGPEPPAVNGQEQPKPPAEQPAANPPQEETKLDKLLKRFHENQMKTKWMRAKLTIVHAGIFDIPGAADEELKAGGSTGEFLFKPGNRCAFKLTSNNNGVEETEEYLAYIQTLWVIKRTGDTVKAERWLIDNEKMSEALLLLQGADPAQLKQTFDMRLIDLMAADEEKRLKEEGYNVKALRESDSQLVELIYKDPTKRDEYKQVDAVIDKTANIAKIKLYNDFNNERTIIWFDDVQINTGDEIPDSAFRFDPAKNGIEKFEDHVLLKEAADIIGRMNLTTRQVIGIKADIEQDKYDVVFADNPDGGHTLRSGTFYFAKPDKFRLDFTQPEKQIVASNGKKFYEYKPDLAQAKIYDLRQMAGKLGGGDRNILLKFFSQDAESLEQDFDFKLLGVEKLNELEVYHFELQLKKKEERSEEVYNTERMELWVEVETLLACRIKGFDMQQPANYYQATLKNISIYDTVPDEAFEPAFPPDVQVTEE
jgi:outer membrane lipoprotein-sorting protein